MADTSKYNWKTTIGGSSGNVGVGGSIGGIQLDTSLLDKITAELRPAASDIINKRGTKIASDWAQGVAVDTSAFRNGILSESHLESDLLYIAQDAVEYGIYQELGTSKMAARPNLVPAIENNYEPLIKDFEDLFK